MMATDAVIRPKTLMMTMTSAKIPKTNAHLAKPIGILFLQAKIMMLMVATITKRIWIQTEMGLRMYLTPVQKEI